MCSSATRSRAGLRTANYESAIGTGHIMSSNGRSDQTSPIEHRPLPEGELLRPNDWSQPAICMLAFFAVGIGLFLLLTSPAEGSSLAGPLRPVYALAWIVFGLLPLRKVRAGVIVEKDGIVVRSPRLRSTSYQWREIKEFAFRPSIIRNSLVIELQDGRQISAHGFGVRSTSDRQRAEALVSELNSRVAANGYGP